jgi:hypothetical protein
LLKGLSVHLDSISVEVVDVVGLLNASSATAVQATRVDIAGPAHVAVEVGAADTTL